VHAWLVHAVSGSALSYLVVFGVVLADALVPIVPSEAVIITATVLAAQGHLIAPLVGLAALGGALVGDNGSHCLGRSLGRRAAARLFRGERARARLRWATGQIGRRAWIVSAGRFVPGGRTATTFASGMLGMPWRRFLGYDAAGCALWVVYAMALGYAGGSAFADSLWKPMLLALAVGLAVALAVELGRRLRSRSRRPPGRGGRAVHAP
jgi:membrane-associated protein